GSTEGWHRVVLLVVWIALMIVFCPVIFEALARRWMRRKWLGPPPASEPTPPTAPPSGFASPAATARRGPPHRRATGGRSWPGGGGGGGWDGGNWARRRGRSGDAATFGGVSAGRTEGGSRPAARLTVLRAPGPGGALARCRGERAERNAVADRPRDRRLCAVQRHSRVSRLLSVALGLTSSGASCGRSLDHPIYRRHV